MSEHVSEGRNESVTESSSDFYVGLYMGRVQYISGTEVRPILIVGRVHQCAVLARHFL